MQGFDKIIGHEQIKQHLQLAIQENKLSHAYILNGEYGAGKKLLATVFAQTLQCEEGGSNPCGRCRSCMQAKSGNHPDIRWVTHEKASIGVDDVRTQVVSDMGIKPYDSPYKIYIIPEAEKMTEQAQNALLKTIEEPPEYGIVVLLAENVNRLLQTILSRCITLNLKAVPDKEVVKYLMEEQKVPDYIAKISAGFAQGNIGKALRYTQSEDFIQMRDDIMHLLKYIDEMQDYEVIESIKMLTGYKVDIVDCLDIIQLWYRDILMLKATSDPNRLLFQDEYSVINKQARKRSYEGLENIMKAIDKAKIRLKANVNFDVVMELMLFSLREN